MIDRERGFVRRFVVADARDVLPDIDAAERRAGELAIGTDMVVIAAVVQVVETKTTIYAAEERLSDLDAAIVEAPDE